MTIENSSPRLPDRHLPIRVIRISEIRSTITNVPHPPMLLSRCPSSISDIFAQGRRDNPTMQFHQNNRIVSSRSSFLDWIQQCHISLLPCTRSVSFGWTGHHRSSFRENGLGDELSENRMSINSFVHHQNGTRYWSTGVLGSGGINPKNSLTMTHYTGERRSDRWIEFCGREKEKNFYNLFYRATSENGSIPYIFHSTSSVRQQTVHKL